MLEVGEQLFGLRGIEHHGRIQLCHKSVLDGADAQFVSGLGRPRGSRKGRDEVSLGLEQHRLRPGELRMGLHLFGMFQIGLTSSSPRVAVQVPPLDIDAHDRQKPTEVVALDVGRAPDLGYLFEGFVPLAGFSHEVGLPDEVDRLPGTIAHTPGKLERLSDKDAGCLRNGRPWP